MSTERDTHFANAAKFLLQAMFDLHNRGYIDVSDDSLDEEWNDEYRLLIAQFAYDLMAHATRHINKSAIYTEHPHFDAFMLAIVPDMTEWPPS